jgi:hypothetical protein
MAGDSTAVPHRVAKTTASTGIENNYTLTGRTTCELLNSQYVQYVLHTTDEPITLDGAPPGSPPSHAIAFRTIDITACPTEIGAGAKLGIYSYWNPNACNTCPYITTSAPYYEQQFEWYNYYGQSGTDQSKNFAEIGNDAVASINLVTGATALTTGGLPYSAADYHTSFNYVIGDELYVIYSQIETAWETALTGPYGYFAYLNMLALTTDEPTHATCTAAQEGACA